jgi:hypothetical protein
VCDNHMILLVQVSPKVIIQSQSQSACQGIHVGSTKKTYVFTRIPRTCESNGNETTG